MRSNGCFDERFACFGAAVTRIYPEVFAETPDHRS